MLYVAHEATGPAAGGTSDRRRHKHDHVAGPALGRTTEVSELHGMWR